jgi:ribonucleoside-diphosphate reductase alpha chain
VAPNTSSSFIMGQQSQSIEPMVSNYYVKDVAKARISFRNPYLEKVLEEKGFNNEDVWLSILKNEGSVRHLEFLTYDEKDVFRTFIEIPQMSIIEMAADRQAFIDQSQSLNLMVGIDTTPDEVAYWIIKAWKLGIKTLYYQLNVSSAQDFTNKRANGECAACAG